jgi:hypothetical protein
MGDKASESRSMESEDLEKELTFSIVIELRWTADGPIRQRVEALVVLLFSALKRTSKSTSDSPQKVYWGYARISFWR